MLQILALCAFLLAPTGAVDPLVDYYVNLIQQNEVEALLNYTARVDNSEFGRHPYNIFPQYGGVYDFIIVSNSSAGAVLAARLSEILQWKILLIEAGGEENNYTEIPSEASFLWLSDLNWGYYTTPQTKSCLGMNEKRCMYPRGKALGGSSAINTMLYVRGNRRDFDEWERLGNPGWSYRDVLPYFKKSERSEIMGDPGYHGTNGLWNVEYSEPNGPALQNFIEANAEVGLNYIDCNGAEQSGVSKFQYNTKNGRRQSTGRAFLAPARNRTNLTVITKALVTKIVFGHFNTAQGVIYRKDDKDYIVYASREVLVSGGAINSPQLLMLSGIGPRQHLQSKRIPVLQDLPVGQNLQDHVFFFGLSIRTNLTTESPTLVETVEQYLQGFGGLTKPSDLTALSFSSTILTESGAPQLEYMFLPNDPTGPILGRFFNVRNDIVGNYSILTNRATDIKIVIINLHPKSKGQVTLQSSDPINFPIIDTAFYTDRCDEDIEQVYKGVKEILNLIDTEPFRRINATLLDYPYCSHLGTSTRAYWYCFIRDLSTTLFHPVRTTAMGPDRRTSVVDSKLRVHGTRNLRVIDAGVIPRPTSGHTNAPTVMIAEKAADIIKRHYGRL